MRGVESCPPRRPFSKIMWSWLGSFLGIYIITIINKYFYNDILSNLFLVGSFGASAVLIYGVPQGELSQPRNVLGGHVISAIVGITVFKYIPLDVTFLGAIAVSISIVAMHLTRTLHPPGGATALIAVIGSSQIHDLGYMFVISPVAIGAILLVLVALLTNNISNNQKRNYPRYWI